MADTSANRDAPAAVTSPSPGTLRDPFWPIGYQPPLPASHTGTPTAVTAQTVDNRPPPAAPRWDEATKRLATTGVMKVGKLFAARVNGSVVEAGEIVSLPYEGMIYRWRVKTISADGPTFLRIDVQPIANP